MRFRAAINYYEKFLGYLEIALIGLTLINSVSGRNLGKVNEAPKE